MAIRIVRLGTAKMEFEGVRLGTVRHPPRGVRKDDWAKDNWFDVWFPNLAPSAPLLAEARKLANGDERDWKKFARRYRMEMSRPENKRLLDALAALSHGANFSLGCYCVDESRCHRSILRALLQEHGAAVVG